MKTKTKKCVVKLDYKLNAILFFMGLPQTIADAADGFNVPVLMLEFDEFCAKPLDGGITVLGRRNNQPKGCLTVCRGKNTLFYS